MPLWVAVAIVAAAFGVRTLLRGPSFDRGDALVLALFVVVLAVTAFARWWIASADAEEHAAHDHDRGRGSANQSPHDEE